LVRGGGTKKVSKREKSRERGKKMARASRFYITYIWGMGMGMGGGEGEGREKGLGLG
jgi:hypothetical protein